MTPRCQRRGGRASSLPSHSQVLEVEKRRGERDERAIERDREVGGAEAGVQPGDSDTIEGLWSQLDISSASWRTCRIIFLNRNRRKDGR